MTRPRDLPYVLADNLVALGLQPEVLLGLWARRDYLIVVRCSPRRCALAKVFRLAGQHVLVAKRRTIVNAGGAARQARGDRRRPSDH